MMTKSLIILLMTTTVAHAEDWFNRSQRDWSDMCRMDMQEVVCRQSISDSWLWQFKRMSGSSGLKVQAAIAC